MATTTPNEGAFNYDDLLGDSSGSWKARLIIIGLTAFLAAAVATFVWWKFVRSSGSAAVAIQTATADRGNVTKSVSTTGTVAASETSSLSFQQAAKVTKVNVTLGQKVKQGDILAEEDNTDLQTALDTANMNMATAQSKLDTLLQGSTASALASADQSVVQAQANYDKAVRALQTLQDRPTATDLAAAQQAVTTAQAQLGQAQQTRTKLDTSSQDAITAAQGGVDKAQKTLDQAQSGSDAAAATVNSSQSALYAAETTYCGTSPNPSPAFCSGSAAPIGSGDQTLLVNASDPVAASKVLTANTSYVKAVSDKTAADDAADTAQTALDDADSALSKAEQGPTAADIASADAAVSAAQVGVQTAQSKLDTLNAGPTQDQLDSAQSDVTSAAASLKSAQAKRDETYQGSLPSDIQQARQSVQSAQQNVTAAQKNLDKAKLIAPFDGTVAALNIQVGDTASAGTGSGSGSSSSTAPIVLNTPDQTRIDMTISETDLPNVKVGQSGFATFDAITGRQFPIVIDSIGTNPTTTQGVVTYVAHAHFVSGPTLGVGQTSPPSAAAAAGGGQSSPPSAGGAGGRTPRANRTPDAGATGSPGTSGTPAASGTPGAGGQGGRAFRGAAGAAISTATPTPGMNARITIVTDQRTNVVRVPNAAITRSGANQTVEVKNADGSTQTATVQTGLADSTNTEITSGIDEGATIIIPRATASTTSSTTGTGATGGTGAGTGFQFGGGGGGGGRGGGGGG